MMKRTLSFLTTVLSVCWASVAYAEGMSFERVAVMVFTDGSENTAATRTAQTRMENILSDNGVEVLDRDKVKELGDVWSQLEDPGYFVTAEDFVDNTEEYSLDGIVRVYLGTDAVTGIAGFYSATAQADIRFVSEDAAVTAITTPTMGVRGNPPSDGLTARAAVTNAVQRAIDTAATKAGFELFETAVPRSVQLELVSIGEQAMGEWQRADRRSGNVRQFAELTNETWRSEEVTCEEVSPDGNVGVVGTHEKHSMAMGSRGGGRLEGSALHVIDLAQQREIIRFDTEATERREKHERGKRPAVYDCAFVGSWRFVAVASGNYMFLFDTERGIELSKLHIEGGLAKSATLMVGRVGDVFRVHLDGGKKRQFFYEIRRKGA
ncbi:MAG: hypothetical protein AAF525_03075 [Pseudomonadota bacterium]